MYGKTKEYIINVFHHIMDPSYLILIRKMDAISEDQHTTDGHTLASLTPTVTLNCIDESGSLY